MVAPAKKKHAGGRPKGSLSKKTLEKLAHEALVREMVGQELRPMTAAQIESAKGFKYLMVRQKHGGKFLRVTESMARAKLGSDEEIIEVWEKDPDTAAYVTLLNRAYGRPAEVITADVTHHAGPQLERILRGLARAGNGHG